jgi:DNA-binding transcriptional MerR regulator
MKINIIALKLKFDAFAGLRRPDASGRQEVNAEKAEKTMIIKMYNTETQETQNNTLKEVAQSLGLPESTLRLYRDEFDELIPTVGSGRRRRYPAEGADVLRRIAQWRRDGRAAGEIRDALSRERQPRERARRRNTDERLDEVVARLTAQAGEIAMLRVEVGALRAEMKRLVEVLREDRPPTLEDALMGSASA